MRPGVPYLSRSTNSQVSHAEFNVNAVAFRPGKIGNDDNFMSGFENIHRRTPCSLVQGATRTVHTENILDGFSELFFQGAILYVIVNFYTIHGLTPAPKGGPSLI
jgi:hypothetical protein